MPDRARVGRDLLVLVMFLTLGLSSPAFGAVADPYEPDNTPAQATAQAVDTVVEHTLFPAGDEDWISFSTTPGSSYALTTDLASGAPYLDTTLELYDSSLGVVKSSEDGGWMFSRLYFSATDSTYYARVVGGWAEEEGSYVLSLFETELRSIRGTVTDEAGQPLAGVAVTPKYEDEREFTSVFTDALGRYELSDLPSGEYRVYTRNEEGYLDEWYGDSLVLIDYYGEWGAATIDLSAANAEDMDIALSMGARISGWVTDEVTGAPLAGARILPSFENSGWAQQEAISDIDGYYEVIGLLPSTYYVCVHEPPGGYAGEYTKEWYENLPYGDDRLVEGRTVVDITSADASSIDFQLVRADYYILTPGWNLIAGGPYSNTGHLILFGFSGASYNSAVASNMVGGSGYWIRSAAPLGSWAGEYVSLTSEAFPLSIHLQSGWNLIGNSTGRSADLPAGFTAFIFDEARYRTTTILAPHQAAWLRADTALTIQLEEHVWDF